MRRARHSGLGPQRHFALQRLQSGNLPDHKVAVYGGRALEAQGQPVRVVADVPLYEAAFVGGREVEHVMVWLVSN